MKIPKYIDDMLNKRARAAERFIELDVNIRKWLDKNDIEVCDDDICTGACSICEPWGSINSIRRCIEDK